MSMHIQVLRVLSLTFLNFRVISSFKLQVSNLQLIQNRMNFLFHKSLLLFTNIWIRRVGGTFLFLAGVTNNAWCPFKFYF